MQGKAILLPGLMTMKALGMRAARHFMNCAEVLLYCSIWGRHMERGSKQKEPDLSTFHQENWVRFLRMPLSPRITWGSKFIISLRVSSVRFPDCSFNFRQPSSSHRRPGRDQDWAGTPDRQVKCPTARNDRRTVDPLIIVLLKWKGEVSSAPAIPLLP